MGTPHYIPRPDGDFSAWVNNYYSALKNWWTLHGYDKHELDGLLDALKKWNASWGSLTAAKAMAAAAAADKAGARAALEPLVRAFALRVQTDDKTTNADRAMLGLTVRGGPSAPAGSPRTRPLVAVSSLQRLQHRLRFVDESSPTRKAKPKGTAGAEVWMAVVDTSQPPPPPGSAYRFVQLSSRGEALAQFKAADAGKTACYTLRWVSPTGEHGPWSEVATATVAA